MGIPYREIGIGLGVIIGIWAFFVTETVGGRIFIIAVMSILFLLPVVWPHPTASLLSFLGWIVFAIGCYLYVKWQNVRIG